MLDGIVENGLLAVLVLVLMRVVALVHRKSRSKLWNYHPTMEGGTALVAALLAIAFKHVSSAMSGSRLGKMIDTAVHVLLGIAPLLAAASYIPDRKFTPSLILDGIGLNVKGGGTQLLVNVAVNALVTIACSLGIAALCTSSSAGILRVLPGVLMHTTQHHLFYTTYVHRSLINMLGSLGAAVATALLSSFCERNSTFSSIWLYGLSEVKENYVGLSFNTALLLGLVCEVYAAIFMKDHLAATVSGWASWPSAIAAALLFERVARRPVSQQEQVLEELYVEPAPAITVLVLWALMFYFIGTTEIAKTEPTREKEK